MFKYSPDTTLHIVCCNVRSSDSISTVDNNVFIYRQASQKLQQYMWAGLQFTPEKYPSLDYNVRYEP